jgi:hypothetical protein
MSTSGDVSGPHTMHSAYAPRLHLSAMSLRPHTLAAGFIAPCLPTLLDAQNSTDRAETTCRELPQLSVSGHCVEPFGTLHARSGND